MGLDSADSHHTTNSMVHEPGGAVYLSDGVFHRTQVETAYGVVRNDDAAIYRFEPSTGKFATHVAYGFANPHGRAVDYWGNEFITDATGNNTYFGPAFSGHIDYPQKHKTLRQFWERPSRPCPGTAILTSRHFPDDWQGNFLNLNVISFQGCYRVQMKPAGSGIDGESLPDLFYSEDPNFRPTFINTGPDGALYFADWHNPIIGHLQHHIRDPNRDHAHGRVYRLTYEGRPLLKPAKIDGQPVPALLELLKEPENQTRELAKVELEKHDPSEVIAALNAWTLKLDRKDPAYEHHMAEALWVHAWLNVPDLDLLARMLRSPEPNARAAATRVLCNWRDRVPTALELLRTQAADESPRVRLEAVRAASFFRTADAVSVVLEARKLPTDYYLDYTIGETMRQLEPLWRKALAQGQQIAGADAKASDFFLGALSAAELVDLPRTPRVLETIVQRVDVPEAQRGIALHELSQQRKTTRAGVLLDMIEATGRTEARAAELGRLLPQQPAGDLEPQRNRIQSLASDVSTPGVRQSAWAALAVADGSFDNVWEKASTRSVVALKDLLAGIPLIYDPDVRAKGYEKVKPLLDSTAPEGDVAELRRAAVGAAVSMKRGQKDTFAALCSMIARRQDLTVAVRGMRVLPRSAWTAPEGSAAADAIVEWARGVPAGERTTPEYVQSIQLAGDLASLAPSEKAAALRKDLKELRVSVFVVNTVREQMRYDTTRLVVEAGKPFEVILENGDFMPHNLVVTTPGSRKKVGEATMKMRPDQLDREGRAFLPRGREILGGTKLLEPGQRATLKMVAPRQEGDYDYLCTYPGHWEMMWGTLVVTKDVDAYLQSHPDAPQHAPAGNHTH
jgi:azurin